MATRFLKVNIDKEMETSYLSYAMSVIIGRALPDIRDGLKPVQRRILWSMWEENITFDSTTKKSARIVGNCIGKYHPHGDVPVYEALVRMAQPFNFLHPLVHGQGNFGSIDGDEPAAMRYTEAKLSKISEEMLKDIEEETVSFLPNYDESLKEPEYLPTRFPNLLINGSSGIAVGMATSIPPHNLSEISDALLHICDNKNANLEQIMKFVKGPDFPTGGLIRGDIKEIYKNGKGQVWIYSRFKIEKGEKGNRIVFYEVPYQTSKSKIVERIASLSSEKIIDGIARVRDESDRRGIRIVVELKKEEDHKMIIRRLYELTPLKTTFSVNMLVIDNKIPVTLPLLDILKRFIEIRRDVVKRRTKYRLDKAKHRLHILEGFLKALTDIDAIIKLIKESDSPSHAKQRLIVKFGFSEIQAQAILDLKLARLSKLERESIEKEFSEVSRQVKELTEILKSDKKLMDVIKSEIKEIKEKYSIQRLSEISEKPPVSEEPGEWNVWVSLSYDNYIGLFTTKKRPRIGLKNFFEHKVSHDIVVVGSSGKVYRLRLSKVKAWTERGIPVSSLVRLRKNEEIVGLFPFRDDGHFFMLTKKGLAKKVRFSDIGDLTGTGEQLFELETDDEIASACNVENKEIIYIITKSGLCLATNEEEFTVRISKAITIQQKTEKEGDGEVEVENISKEPDEILLVTSDKDKQFLIIATELGFVKKMSVQDIKIQGKGGIGIAIANIEKGGKVMGAVLANDEDEICLVQQTGKPIFIKVSKIQKLGRQAIGKKLSDEKIISLGRVSI